MVMTPAKTYAEWMRERGLSLTELVERSGLEIRVVEAVACARYTPSPEQRRALADALGVPVEQVVWGHQNPVLELYGHGPQFGRTP
jgi:transcriptional regulator with XRE-family HTH domain